MDELGVIHGRFQVLHNDHLTYLLAGKERCRHLVVAITNPDPRTTKSDAADPARSRPENNPLTYFERYTLVRNALRNEGIDYDDFSIVPLPINVPELYRYYVPLTATFYLTIYDDWGKRKLEQFTSLGLKTEVLWTRPLEEKGISACDVREKILRGEPWEMLVPPVVAVLLNEWSISGRIRTYSGDDTTS